MSNCCEQPVSRDWNVTLAVEPEWYAVHTRFQHEKSVVSHLQREGITTFLPLVTEVHRWSDRRKLVELPLFSCYVFVRISLVPELWHKVMKTSGAMIPMVDSMIRATPGFIIGLSCRTSLVARDMMSPTLWRL